MAAPPAIPPSTPREPRLDRLALGLVALSTALHVAYAGLLALSPQEAYYWTWSRDLSRSYFDHPPLAAWTIRAFTAPFGDSERVVRLAAAFHSTVFVVFLWLATRRLFGSRGALAAVVAGLSVLLFGLGQVIITPDGPLLSGWAMALYFTVRTLDEEQPRWLLAAGAATGWAMLGKYTGGLLLPQIMAVLLLDPRGRRMLATPWPWLGAALAFALFSPVVLWNAEHQFASFGFQTAERAQASRFRPVLVGRFLALQALLVSPVMLLVLVEAVVQAFRRRTEAPWRICFWFAAPLMLLAAVVSPFHWVKGNWLAPAYPAALAAAAALYVGGGAWRRRAGLAAVAVALCFSVYMHLVPLWPGLWFPSPRDEGSAGWRELTARVEAERAGLPEGSFVAGCNYKVSAELGYYLPGRPRTWSGELAGDHGLQYRFWFEPAELLGRTGLVVRDTRERKTCLRLAEACSALQPLPSLTVLRGAAKVTTFELWRCEGYRGPPASPPGAPEE